MVHLFSLLLGIPLNEHLFVPSLADSLFLFLFLYFAVIITK